MHIPAGPLLKQQVGLLALAASLWAVTAVSAQELKPIPLPKPQLTAGMPLMQALAQRQTTRAFRDQPRSKAGAGSDSALGHE